MEKKRNEMINGCCVCGDEQGSSENPLVYCDGPDCNIGVHQACYGIVSVPKGNWYCKKCESRDLDLSIRCELCPFKGGALKRTDNEKWAHVVCALYIPEVEFRNVFTMEPIAISEVPRERFSKMCYICNENNRSLCATVGACMQCNKAGCKQRFHVTCAQISGLLCEEAGKHADNITYCGYCDDHGAKVKKRTVTAIQSYELVYPHENVISVEHDQSVKEKQSSNKDLYSSSKKETSHQNLNLRINVSRNPPTIIGSSVNTTESTENDADVKVKDIAAKKKRKLKSKSHKKRKTRENKYNFDESVSCTQTPDVEEDSVKNKEDLPMDGIASICTDIGVKSTELPGSNNYKNVTEPEITMDTESLSIESENLWTSTENSKQIENATDNNNKFPAIIAAGHGLGKLLEKQWEQASAFLMEQAEHHNVARSLNELHQLKAAIVKAEQEEIRLSASIDHFSSIISKLSVSNKTAELIDQSTNSSQDRSAEEFEQVLSRLQELLRLPDKKKPS